MTPITYSKAFSEGVREEMERDPSIFIMGTDLLARGGNFAQLVGIGAEFGPERVRDTPISEAAMVAAGVGAAVGGMRPIVDLNFVDFAFGAMDEIVNQAAKMRYMLRVPVPLVIRASYGVTLYAMQHNNSIEAWFAHTPGLIVLTPATPADAKGLIKSALRGEDPVIFLMHKRLGGSRGEVGGPDDLVPIGEARIARRRRRHHCRHIRRDAAAVPEAGDTACRGRHRCGSHRPPLGDAARPRSDRVVGPPDRPRRCRRRGTSFPRYRC